MTTSEFQLLYVDLYFALFLFCSHFLASLHLLKPYSSLDLPHLVETRKAGVHSISYVVSSYGGGTLWSCEPECQYIGVSDERTSITRQHEPYSRCHTRFLAYPMAI